MKSKRLGSDHTRHVLVFDKGDEAVEELRAFATQEQLTAGSFTGIGAFSELTLGFFDREHKDYRRIPLTEQVEVLTVAGDIAVKEGQPHVHAHVVVGKGRRHGLGRPSAEGPSRRRSRRHSCH